MQKFFLFSQMNNMWQVQMQQLASSFQHGTHQQQFRGGSSSPWQQDGPAHWTQRPAHKQDVGGHCSREQQQRHGGKERHWRDGHRNDFYQHDERGGGRNRDYPPDRRRESRDGRWRKY